MSGPLGVTHLMVFSQPSTSSISIPSTSTSTAGAAKTKTAKQINDEHERSLIEGTTTVNLRLIRLPRGPTLNFKILRYSLASDILRMARRPRSVGREFAEAPLVSFDPHLCEPRERALLIFLVDLFSSLFSRDSVEKINNSNS